MTRNPAHPHGQPTLGDLMFRFLANRSDAAGAAVESAQGEVEPHEVAAGFRVDPRAAWTDAVAPLNAPAGSLPNDWATLAGQPAAAFAVPMAAGNFPQQVKDLQPLISRFEPDRLRPTAGQASMPGLSGLRNWVGRESAKSPQQALLAAGVARVLGDHDRAAEILLKAEPQCTAALRPLWQNETAALLWHRGRCDEALAAWKTMPETPAVLFNRGMALLFLGKSAEARTALSRAIEELPEASGWNALARLYLAVAEMQA
jgi:tetratricopeptide (TPR) repeat protein